MFQHILMTKNVPHGNLWSIKKSVTLYIYRYIYIFENMHNDKSFLHPCGNSCSGVFALCLDLVHSRLQLYFSFLYYSRFLLGQNLSLNVFALVCLVTQHSNETSNLLLRFKKSRHSSNCECLIKAETKGWDYYNGSCGESNIMSISTALILHNCRVTSSSTISRS